MGFKIKSIFGGGSSPTDAEGNQEPHDGQVETANRPEEAEAPSDLPETEHKEYLTDKVVPEEPPIEAPVFQDSPVEEEELKKAPPAPPRRKPRNQDELFLEAIPERAKSAPDHLKSILQGKILIEILPSNKKFLIECQPDDPCTVTEVTTAVAADCTIALHGKDLMRISDGDLNPQILMLSHKAKVWGNPRLATYVFNLIAPYSSNF